MTAAEHRDSIDVGTDLSSLVERLGLILRADRRLLLGICGAPGAGKSTLAERLASLVGDEAIVVPMDGFHIATTALASPEHVDRRGAIDTFDVAGYLTLMARLRADAEDVTYAPAFDRAIGEPVAGAIAVTRQHRIVITEGNYLLSRESGWRDLRQLLDETWYLELANDIRIERLTARHRRFGTTAEVAYARARGSDEDNARAIASARGDADLVIRLIDHLESHG
ncbi:nucleoside/nucleotide kinase family protein [Parafrigoribacterium soli]|uniref:nucleoside/nucleotide kinase family protein n=1 Tax=Parafrigoribacterium soli TaxID=3144663 RepID=UPI0032ECBA55